MRQRETNDLLLYLLSKRLIRLPFYGTQQSRNMEAIQRHSKICNQKGGLAMNQPTTYALGLFHGGLIIGFVWIMFRSIGKK
jgi:hypothetical protein